MIIFILLFGILNFLLFVVVIKQKFWFENWRLSTLAASVIVGLLCWGSTEVFSYIQSLMSLNIILFWLFCCVGLWILCFPIRRDLLKQVQTLPGEFSDIRVALGKYHWFGIPVFMIIIALFIIALMSPPNNWDSMTYHLSRVMHWIQNRNLNFYPTHVERQNHMSPGAEILILNIYVFTGSDRMVNFVQYFSFILVIIGLSWIAKNLGGSIKAEFSSLLVGLTVPMAILQSTSTQNDLVLSLWLICFVSFGLVAIEENKKIGWLFAGTSLGLATLTKSKM